MAPICVLFHSPLLSRGRSPLCGSADITPFHTADFTVGFALCFTLKARSLRKEIVVCVCKLAAAERKGAGWRTDGWIHLHQCRIRPAGLRCPHTCRFGSCDSKEINYTLSYSSFPVLQKLRSRVQQHFFLRLSQDISSFFQFISLPDPQM